jgi:hypothetical protein
MPLGEPNLLAKKKILLFRGGNLNSCCMQFSRKRYIDKYDAGGNIL